MTTFLDRLIESLTGAAEYNQDENVVPAAVLWTDKERQWEPLLPDLRKKLPHLLTFGAYDLSSKSGPAIWIKCMVGRALPPVDWSSESVPIVYLPGISRQELRAVEECPRHLQPLAELQYRGVYWTQSNSRDWTILAFLQSKSGGLGLDVARDSATVEAMKHALIHLAATPIEELQGKRLEAQDFATLVLPDPVRDILIWLNSPADTYSRWDENKRRTFCEICESQYGFNPEKDGELTAAELLGKRDQKNWQKVWDRFAEIPSRYAKVPELLRKARPKKEDLFFKRSSWPQDNEAMENELRIDLANLRDCSPAKAMEKISALDSRHGERRRWIWADLMQAPLACALKHLKILVDEAHQGLNGATPDEIAQAYVNKGWRVDAAVLDALAELRDNHDADAVSAAIRAVYKPWLQDTAEKFQSLVKNHLPTFLQGLNKQVTHIENGTVLLFVDGLRFDIAQKLKQILLEKDWDLADKWHWVALPSVTPTSKPAVSPVADMLSNKSTPEEFRPSVKAAAKVLTPDRFSQLLIENGYQVLRPNQIGDPSGKAWTEYGDLDRYGHMEGWKLAKRTGELLGGVTKRIEELLDAGWKIIRIVTDHGWLLLPGGLPKVEMPAFLTETRWGRCAVLRTTSVVTMMVVPWFWNAEVQIAIAPGISAFKAGLEYDHGGLTLQECVVSEFTVRPKGAAKPKVNILSIEWRGLACRIRIEGAAPGMFADLRTKTADAKTSVTQKRQVEERGQVSLFVEDDSLEGTAAIAVIEDDKGNVIAKLSTTIGG